MISVYDDKSQCCGCGLCASKCPASAITLKYTDGFLYPEINADKCIDCKLCKTVCPMTKEYIKSDYEAHGYAVKHTDIDIRKKSSSGGVFTVLSDAFIEDGVVYGAVFDENMTVKHIGTDDKSVRDRMLGSKYVQTDMTSVYKSVETDLANGKRVLFCGTPCGVSAVNQAFGDNENLYTADIICHGVPSPSVFKSFIDCLSDKYKKRVTDYKFRDKEHGGWRKYSGKAVFEDNTEVFGTPLVNAFIEIFRFDLCMRPSCAKCPYASMTRQGDVTLSDFWGIENVMPDFDDGNGVSAVMVNTKKGEKLMEYIKSGTVFEDCAVTDIAKRQPNTRKPSVPSYKSERFMKDYAETNFKKLLTKYTSVGLKRRLIEKIKPFLKGR